MSTYRRKVTEILRQSTFTTQKNISAMHLDSSRWFFLTTCVKMMLKELIKVSLTLNYLQFITEFFPRWSYIFLLFSSFFGLICASRAIIWGDTIYFLRFSTSVCILLHGFIRHSIQVSIASLNRLTEWQTQTSAQNRMKPKTEWF